MTLRTRLAKPELNREDAPLVVAVAPEHWSAELQQSEIERLIAPKGLRSFELLMVEQRGITAAAIGYVGPAADFFAEIAANSRRIGVSTNYGGSIDD